MSKVLVSYPNTLSRKNASRNVSHHYPIMFNKIMDIGKIDMEDVTNFAKQYSLRPNSDFTDFAQDQEIYLQLNPLNFSFCKDIDIKYDFKINHLKNILGNYIYFATEINKFKNKIESLDIENNKFKNEIELLDNENKEFQNRIENLIKNDEQKIKFLSYNLYHLKDNEFKLKAQNKLLKKEIKNLNQTN